MVLEIKTVNNTDAIHRQHNNYQFYRYLRHIKRSKENSFPNFAVAKKGQSPARPKHLQLCLPPYEDLKGKAKQKLNNCL